MFSGVQASDAKCSEKLSFFISSLNSVCLLLAFVLCMAVK